MGTGAGAGGGGSLATEESGWRQPRRLREGLAGSFLLLSLPGAAEVSRQAGDEVASPTRAPLLPGDLDMS